MRKKLLTCLLTGATAIAMCIPVMASTATLSSTNSTDTTSEEIIINDNDDGMDVNLPDNETLYKGYVDELFGFSDDKLNTYESINPANTLDELNLFIYNSLKTKIESVAAGKTSSTVFKVTLPKNASGYLDHNTIVRSLLVNCPYELYWYDKTEGYSYVINNSNLTVTFSFTVAEGYRKSGAEYVADTTKTGAATTAKQNADAIVSKYASYTDYNKLYAYKEEICGLVTYNKEAAENDDYPYGDPWQLIYVFDQNPDTNVVCEGYSKAFQYLCDHTSFSNSSIACRTISGYMIYEDGSDGHMWNIVTMDDEKTYIVDVTNCDEDSIGESDKLFLAGAIGSVSSGYIWTTTDSDGDSVSILYTYNFSTSATSVYSKKDLTLFHADYDNDACKNATTYLTNVKSATCTKDGYTGDTYCNNCGRVAQYGSVIPAKGHSAKAHIAAKATTAKSGSIQYICTVCNTLTKTTPIAYPKKYVLSTSSYAYNGKVKKPGLKIYDKNNKLISSANYTITYPSGRKKVGTYTYKITFKGNYYSGTKTVSFKIVPKKAVLKKVTVGSKSMVVYAKAKASAFAGARYQVAYKASGSSKWIYTTTTKTSKKISKLATGKKYKVKIRAYKKVGNKTYYGKWSKAIKTNAIR